MTQRDDPAADAATGAPSGAPGMKELYRAQLLDGLGGWTGTVIAAIPTVVFVIVNTLDGLRAAIIAAVASALILTVYRLIRRQSIQQALSGLFGVAIAVLIAHHTGQARGYFLYGIWTSFAYAAVFLVTLVVRKPLVGLVWEFLDPSPQVPPVAPVAQPSADTGAPAESAVLAWYRRRPLLRAYDLATALAALIFLARGLVQLALYHRNDTGWLAVARIAMGYPLTIAAVGFGFWAVNRARRRIAAHAG
jgi:hypothetical protein